LERLHAGSGGAGSGPAAGTAVSAWAAGGEDGEAAVPESVTLETASRVRLVCRFLAVPEEEDFWRLHIVLEAEARVLVAAVARGQTALASADTRGLSDSLEAFGAGLTRLNECHTQLWADGGRRDVVLARRLRPFLQAGLSTEQQDMHLGCLYYTARSAILPMALLFLGIRHSEPHPLIRTVHKAVRAMPPPHQAFLATLSKAGGGDVRSHLHHIAGRTPVHELALLEAGFNGCIEELLRYCSRRSNLVCRAFPHIAESFREYYHKPLEGCIHQARCKLLLQRRMHGPAVRGAGVRARGAACRSSTDDAGGAGANGHGAVLGTPAIPQSLSASLPCISGEQRRLDSADSHIAACVAGCSAAGADGAREAAARHETGHARTRSPVQATHLSSAVHPQGAEGRGRGVGAGGAHHASAQPRTGEDEGEGAVTGQEQAPGAWRQSPVADRARCLVEPTAQSQHHASLSLAERRRTN